MSVKHFRIIGSFVQRGNKQIFTKEVTELKEARALDKVYSLVGSNHGIKRAQIKIEKVEEFKPEAKKVLPAKAKKGMLKAEGTSVREKEAAHEGAPKEKGDNKAASPDANASAHPPGAAGE
ncbi:MAG: 50S ribosomal protein L18Ae [archaeon]